MKLNSIQIDAIYIINLESDVERKNHILVLLEKYDIKSITSKVIFFNGYDYRYKPIEKEQNFIGTPGGYGCTKSHLGCITDARENNYNTILIFEDDIIVHKLFKSRWNSIIIPDDWKLVHLGAMQINWDGIALDENQSFYKSSKTLGGFSYILNKDMFSKVLDYYDIHRRPIDEILIILQNEQPCFTIYPNLFINYVNKSYIRYRNKWTIQNTCNFFKWNLDDFDLSHVNSFS